MQRCDLTDNSNELGTATDTDAVAGCVNHANNAASNAAMAIVAAVRADARADPRDIPCGSTEVRRHQAPV